MLEWMWKNWNTHTSLAGMENSTTLKSSLAVLLSFNPPELRVTAGLD